MKRIVDVVTRRLSPWSFVSFANSETFNHVSSLRLLIPQIKSLSRPYPCHLNISIYLPRNLVHIHQTFTSIQDQIILEDTTKYVLMIHRLKMATGKGIFALSNEMILKRAMYARTVSTVCIHAFIE